MRVYRTRNAGASWEPLTRGLPQKGAYETVLRDAMTADSLDPTGIYIGTRSGQLFGSRDEGKTWEKVLDGLPSIVCVRCAVFRRCVAAFTIDIVQTVAHDRDPVRHKICANSQVAPYEKRLSVPVTFHIPGALREFTGGRGVVTMELLPGTVGDALSALWTRHPGVRDRVVNEQGQVRQHLNIFVGNENIRYTGGLTTVVLDGNEISIVPAVSGGSRSMNSTAVEAF